METLIHWPKPMWEHKGLALENPYLPETERICKEVVSLPMSTENNARTRGYRGTGYPQVLQLMGAHGDLRPGPLPFEEEKFDI